MDNFISILRDASSPEELDQYKIQLFRENVRLKTDRYDLEVMHEQNESEMRKLQDLRERLDEDRKQLEEETKQLKKELLEEQKRLKEDTIFFGKKQMVLENAFRQLDVERRKLESEKKAFLQDSSHGKSASKRYSDYSQGVFFRGVTNSLALKKRYKDLLKIFHPDNLCGDNETLTLINKEYENLKRDLNI